MHEEVLFRFSGQRAGHGGSPDFMHPTVNAEHGGVMDLGKQKKKKKKKNTRRLRREGRG